MASGRPDFRILGRLQVVTAGAEAALGPPKQRALLALLLLHSNRPLSADWLIERLWDGKPPVTAATAVQGYISHLRKILGQESIRTELGGYSLCVEPDVVDATRFERRLAEAGELRAADRLEAAAGLLSEALAEWHGEALADFRFEAFAHDEAVRLEELRLYALEEQIEVNLALGLHAEALNELGPLVRDHPLRERLQLGLMLALYRSGRQADALAAYRETRRTLDGLGLEPSRRLQALERAILNRDPELAAPERRAVVLDARPLPPPTPFVGRVDEVATICDRLRDPSIRLVTLTGAGGSGKTRLALEVGRLLEEHYRDGVAFVGLAAIGDPELLMPSIAQALSVNELAGETVDETLAKWLASRRLLLILDNLEQLLPAVGRLTPVLAAAPELQVLATSRAALRLSGEHEVPIAPLLRSDSLELLLQRARALRPNLDPTENELLVLGDVCAQLDDLPLAIELAAARLKILTPAALLSRLDQRLGVLTGGASDLPDRQRTLRATLDWSFALLDEGERRLFETLAPFVGGATLEAVEGVVTDDDVLERLASLVDKSLVRPHVQGGETRFQMLRVVREYALERLAERPDSDAVHARHAAWFAALAIRARPELLRADQAVWLDRLEREHDNIRGALTFLLDRGDLRTAVAAASSLWHFWESRAYLTEGAGWLARVLSEATDRESDEYGHALNGAGCLASSRGETALAIDYHRRAAELYERIGDRRGLAWSLNNMALVLTAERELSQAREMLERSLNLARELGEQWLEASTLINLGNVAYFEEEWDRAEHLQEDGRRLSEALGDTWRAALGCLNLGWIHVGQGDEERALVRFREAIGAFGLLRELRQLPDALEGLAVTVTRSGDEAAGACLFGAADGVRAAIAVPREPNQTELYPYVAQAREALGGERYELELERGRLMSTEEAIEFALARPASAPT